MINHQTINVNLFGECDMSDIKDVSGLLNDIDVKFVSFDKFKLFAKVYLERDIRVGRLATGNNYYILSIDTGDLIFTAVESREIVDEYLKYLGSTIDLNKVYFSPVVVKFN